MLSLAQGHSGTLTPLGQGFFLPLLMGAPVVGASSPQGQAVRHVGTHHLPKDLA